MTTWSLTPLFNELDVLEIRLATLDPVVDVHVIAESTLCYSGKKKPLNFWENRERFSPWLDKIRYVVVDDMPAGGRDISPKEMFSPSNSVRWKRENHQRQALIRGCEDMQDRDLVLLSDLDEIPHPELVEEQDIDHLKPGTTDRFFMPQHVMYLNWRWNDPGIVAICRFARGWTLKQIGPQRLRNFEPPPKIYEENGWHFSYMGGPEMISYKIKNAAHNELAQPDYYNPDRIKERMASQVDMFDRDYRKPEVVSIDTLPPYVKQNQDKFEHLLDLSE